MLYLDTETFSELDIRKVGTYRYTRNCEVMLVGYAIDDEPAKVWDLTENITMPSCLENYLFNTDGLMTAHNAMFDRNVIINTIADIPVERFRCTMVKAYTLGLPPALGQLGEVIGMPEDEQKMKQGKKLVNRFSKPAPKNHKVDRYTKDNDPDNWEQFIEYCRQDVETMRTIDKELQEWVYPGSEELTLWELDQEINDRGIYVDVDFVNQAIELVETTTEILNRELKEITEGCVSGATSLSALSKWVNAQGVRVTGLDKASIIALLKEELPDTVRRALEIRQQVGKSSTAKYKTLLTAINEDHRLRGALQFYGAGRTGRWAGRMFQPHNLPRPTIDQIAGSAAIENNTVELLYDDCMAVASSCVRSAIAAPPGKKLLVADLANIEGRMLAWLSDEKWKLNAFKEYDKGTGPDLYRLAYARSFSIAVDMVNKEQRQVGKVQELALGYQGAIGAFNSMAKEYNVFLPDEEVLRIVVAWRNAHKYTVRYWQDAQNAAHRAVKRPGKVFSAGKIQFSVRDNVLLIKLPSGRFLCYQDPVLEDDTDRQGRPKKVLVYSGVHPTTKKWWRISTYGGKLVENCTQAASRDVLAHGMRNVNAMGTDIVLTVHDEIVCEVDEDSETTVEDINKCLTNGPAWAEGLPLAAEGYESKRYKK